MRAHPLRLSGVRATALHQHTGANSVPESAAGNVPVLVQAWLHWAKDNGYQW